MHIKKHHLIHFRRMFLKSSKALVVNGLIKSTIDFEDSYIIPPNLFDKQKLFILIQIGNTLFENSINLLAVNSKHQ